MADSRGLACSNAELLAKLGARGHAKLRRELTVKARPQPGTPAAALRCLRTDFAFLREGDVLWLPRRWMALAATLGPVEDRTPAPALVGAPAVLAIELYPYQRAFLDFALAELAGARRAGRLYVQMGTGTGKTVLGVAIAAALNVTTLVCAPTKAIAEQWLAEFAAAAPGLRAALFSNARPRLPPAADVVVAIFNTLRAKEPAFFAQFGLVLCDEAHELCSPKNVEILRRGQARYVVGLSATPAGRPDGMDALVEKFLGRPIPLEQVAAGAAALQFPGRVLRIDYAGDPRHAVNVVNAVTGSVSAVETIGRLVQDPARLALVVALVAWLLQLHESLPAARLADWGLAAGQRHCVFVFAEHRAYLPQLRDALDAALPGAGILAPEIPLLRGGVGAEEFGAALEARVVLTTYGFSRRGVSLPQMTALIKATPRRHGGLQIDGRVTRRTADAAQREIRRIVIDICDTATGLKSQARTRALAYRERGWPIHSRAAKWDDDRALWRGFESAPLEVRRGAAAVGAAAAGAPPGRPGSPPPLDLAALDELLGGAAL